MIDGSGTGSGVILIAEKNIPSDDAGPFPDRCWQQSIQLNIKEGDIKIFYLVAGPCS